MPCAHAGLEITDEAFDQVVAHLVATLQELGVTSPLNVAIGAQLAPLRAQVVQAPAQRKAA